MLKSVFWHLPLVYLAHRTSILIWNDVNGLHAIRAKFKPTVSSPTLPDLEGT